MLMVNLKINSLLAAAAILGLCAAAALPRAIESAALIAMRDDPAAIAEHRLDHTFNVEVARREIEQALKADDIDLARSFVELAAARQVPLDRRLIERVAEMNEPAAVVVRTAGAVTRGFISGEPHDAASFAGTALGDMFVFGDVRDVWREGLRLANGEKADELILGLACVGLAITAGTYASLGAATPARIGVSLMKGARKAGRITDRMAGWLSRSVRDTVDAAAVRRVFAGVAAAEPEMVARAAREVVKVEKSKELARMAADIGVIQARAGTRAALDGLKIVHGPHDVVRVAKLAEKQRGKTRAVLKVAGAGAIFLSVSAFELASWLVWAALALFGCASTLKSAAERITLRVLHRRRARRVLAEARPAMASMAARG